VASKNKKSIWRKTGKFLFILWALNLSYIILTKWVHPPITMVMLGAWAKGYGLQRDYIRFDEMGQACKLAVICAEDQRFTEHSGFDVDAIRKAIEYNQDSTHTIQRGASTISQQTAKNVFLWNGRNWVRKGLEVYHTAMIELIWGKKRILENYLNVAEMGKGVFGIEAAAKHYFNKSAKELSKREAAWIAVILPNPIKFSIEKPSTRLIRRHNWILRQMNNLSTDPDIQALLETKSPEKKPH